MSLQPLQEIFEGRCAICSKPLKPTRTAKLHAENCARKARLKVKRGLRKLRSK